MIDKIENIYNVLDPEDSVLGSLYLVDKEKSIWHFVKEDDLNGEPLLELVGFKEDEAQKSCLEFLQGRIDPEVYNSKLVIHDNWIEREENE